MGILFWKRTTGVLKSSATQLPPRSFLESNSANKDMNPEMELRLTHARTCAGPIKDSGDRASICRGGYACCSEDHMEKEKQHQTMGRHEEGKNRNKKKGKKRETHSATHASSMHMKRRKRRRNVKRRKECDEAKGKREEETQGNSLTSTHSHHTSSPQKNSLIRALGSQNDQ